MKILNLILNGTCKIIWKRYSFLIFSQLFSSTEISLFQEETRAAFEGEIKQGYIYDNIWIPWTETKFNIHPQNTLYYSNKVRNIKEFLGYFPITTLIVSVVIATISILTFRLFLQKSSVSLLGGLVGGIANAITIVILNKVYRKVATKLNDWGNSIGFIVTH